MDHAFAPHAWADFYRDRRGWHRRALTQVHGVVQSWRDSSVHRHVRKTSQRQGCNNQPHFLAGRCSLHAQRSLGRTKSTDESTCRLTNATAAFRQQLTGSMNLKRVATVALPLLPVSQPLSQPFGSPAAYKEFRGFAPPPRGKVAFIAAHLFRCQRTQEPAVEQMILGCSSTALVPSTIVLRSAIPCQVARFEPTPIQCQIKPAHPRRGLLRSGSSVTLLRLHYQLRIGRRRVRLRYRHSSWAPRGVCCVFSRRACGGRTPRL